MVMAPSLRLALLFHALAFTKALITDYDEDFKTMETSYDVTVASAFPGCSAHKGFTFSGSSSNTPSIKVDSAEDCMAQCMEAVDCTAYTYDSSENCQLISTIIGQKTKQEPGTTAGLCAKPSNRAHVAGCTQEAFAFLGKTLKVNYTSDADGCAALCQSTSGCGSYTWASLPGTTTKNCFLKSSAAGQVISKSTEVTLIADANDDKTFKLLKATKKAAELRDDSLFSPSQAPSSFFSGTCVPGPPSCPSEKLSSGGFAGGTCSGFWNFTCPVGYYPMHLDVDTAALLVGWGWNAECTTETIHFFCCDPYCEGCHDPMISSGESDDPSEADSRRLQSSVDLEVCKDPKDGASTYTYSCEIETTGQLTRWMSSSVSAVADTDVSSADGSSSSALIVGGTVAAVVALGGFGLAMRREVAKRTEAASEIEMSCAMEADGDMAL